MKPTTLAEAYEMQGAFLANQTRTRGAVAGYKVALSSPELQKLARLGEPVSGAILAKTIHESPCTIRGADYQHLGIECEFAFVMGADLHAANAPFTPEQVAEAIGAVAIAFELVDDRNVGYSQFAEAILSGVVDNAWNAGIVLGPHMEAWREVKFEPSDGKMVVNDVVVGQGYGLSLTQEPLQALVWLANHLARRGISLAREMVVMTGTLDEMQFVTRGDMARFEMRGMGEVNLEIV